MSQSTQNSPTHTGMLKTIAAAFVTIIAFLGLALLWFKESPTTPFKPTIFQGTTDNNSLPSLSYNNDQAASSIPIKSVLLDKRPSENTSLPASIKQLETPTPQALVRQQNAVKNLDQFFSQLDTKSYYQNTFTEPSSKKHLATLLQKIINNPPVISGEADDLFTLLQNTAHFFRILGAQNISLTKNIISDNKKDIEKLASDLYLVLNDQEALARDYNITPSPEALYSYGCFFLNTMGGRLYMFRRDLELRMLLSYYSLLFVYYAEITGTNHHGLDVRPFLKTLIYEMENYGQKLKQRDIYLARLYNLENSLN